MAAWTMSTWRSSVEIGRNFAAQRMTNGARINRTNDEPKTIFQVGFSEPARSIIEQPVMKTATGNAPTPMIDIALRTGPVTWSSQPRNTSNSPMVTAKIGPLTSLRHLKPRSPLIIMTPTDHIADSTPMLCTNNKASALPPHRLSTTGAAVKPKFWQPALMAKVRRPFPRSSPISRATAMPIAKPARMSPKPSRIDQPTTDPLLRTSLPRILSRMKHGSITQKTTCITPASCSFLTTPIFRRTAPATMSRYTGRTDATTAAGEITGAGFRPTRARASAKFCKRLSVGKESFGWKVWAEEWAEILQFA